jgi:hypothetical protein
MAIQLGVIMKKILILVLMFLSVNAMAANKSVTDNLVNAVSKKTADKKATLLIFNYNNDKDIAVATEKIKAKLIINEIGLTDKKKTTQILQSLNIERPIFNPLITKQLGILFKSGVIITLESRKKEIEIIARETKKGKIIFSETTAIKNLIGSVPVVAITPALPKIEISTPTKTADVKISTPMAKVVKPLVVEVSTPTVKLPKITVVEVSTPTAKPIKTADVKVAPIAKKEERAKTAMEEKLERQLELLLAQTKRLETKLDEREDIKQGIVRKRKHTVNLGLEYGLYQSKFRFTEPLQQYYGANAFKETGSQIIKLTYERKLNKKYSLGFSLGREMSPDEILDQAGSEIFDMAAESNFMTVYLRKKINKRWGYFGGVGFNSFTLKTSGVSSSSGGSVNGSFLGSKIAPHVKIGADYAVKKVVLEFGVRYLFMGIIDNVEDSNNRLIIINGNQFATKAKGQSLAANEKPFEVDMGSLGVYFGIKFDLKTWGE